MFFAHELLNFTSFVNSVAFIDVRDEFQIIYLMWVGKEDILLMSYSNKTGNFNFDLLSTFSILKIFF